MKIDTEKSKVLDASKAYNGEPGILNSKLCANGQNHYGRNSFPSRFSSMP